MHRLVALAHERLDLPLLGRLAGALLFLRQDGLELLALLDARHDRLGLGLGLLFGLGLLDLVGGHLALGLGERYVAFAERLDLDDLEATLGPLRTDERARL